MRASLDGYKLNMTHKCFVSYSDIMIKDTQGKHCVTTNEFKDVLQGSQIGDGVKQYCLTLQLLD